jgi:hypothetical protein
MNDISVTEQLLEEFPMPDNIPDDILVVGHVDRQSTDTRISEYRRRHKLDRLSELAEHHHHEAQVHATKVREEALKALNSAYRCGCTLIALQEKAPHGSFLEDGKIRGTSMTKSTGYRFMDLARNAHRLNDFRGFPSLRGALEHIARKRRSEQQQEFEDLHELPPAEPITVNRKPRTKRPWQDGVRKRISGLVSDVRQQMHDDPNRTLEVISAGILELQQLQSELQDYIEEESNR